MQVSAERSQEAEDLHLRRMLQLARASRDALAARLKHCRLRLQEIDVMRTITAEELEETEASLRRANEQVEEMEHLVPDVKKPTLADCGITLGGARWDDRSDGESSHGSYKSPSLSSDDDHGTI